MGEQSGWAGASLGLPPRLCGSSIVALTKAALFLPTSIPCQHPSAFRLQISCPLAAFQEAAWAQNVDGKWISGAGWWKVALCRGQGWQGQVHVEGLLSRNLMSRLGGPQRWPGCSSLESYILC